MKLEEMNKRADEHLNNLDKIVDKYRAVFAHKVSSLPEEVKNAMGESYFYYNPSYISSPKNIKYEDLDDFEKNKINEDLKDTLLKFKIADVAQSIERLKSSSENVKDSYKRIEKIKEIADILSKYNNDAKKEARYIDLLLDESAFLTIGNIRIKPFSNISLNSILYNYPEKDKEVEEQDNIDHYLSEQEKKIEKRETVEVPDFLRKDKYKKVKEEKKKDGNLYAKITKVDEQKEAKESIDAKVSEVKEEKGTLDKAVKVREKSTETPKVKPYSAESLVEKYSVNPKEVKPFVERFGYFNTDKIIQETRDKKYDLKDFLKLYYAIESQLSNKGMLSKISATTDIIKSMNGERIGKAIKLINHYNTRNSAYSLSYSVISELKRQRRISTQENPIVEYTKDIASSLAEKIRNRYYGINGLVRN